ncbi:cell envelope integrity EipB family protein [Aquamicrobium segne]|uniref:Cell envelope integrity EipB family protein n=1 Tax=Aquamicrobium segne TaxID=469547 RepID=A0ABW0GXR2_9HYPH
MRRLRLAYTILLLPIGFSTIPALAAPVLQPHRAVYDVFLGKASERSGITSIDGRMVYEFNGSQCEGYTVRFRLVTRIGTADMMRMTDQQTTTHEDGQAENFSFATKTFIDQQPEQEVKGKAHRQKDGISIDIDQPEPVEVRLGAAQFPTQHMIDLIERAQKGESFYETSLYDGSEDADQDMLTTIVIGKPGLTGQDDPEMSVLSGLEKEESWPVDIAYFKHENSGGGEETPDYRISFRMHSNGLTRNLKMDYGDFTMNGRLVDLALFDMPDPKACKK